MSFTSCFLNWNFILTFSYQIDLASTFSAMLNKGGERRHHYLVMILEEKLCAFYHWVSSYLWTYHIWSLLLLYFIWCLLLPNPGLLFILGLYNTELGSLRVHFVEIFYHEWMLNTVLFPAAIEVIIWFLAFILLMWYITMNDLYILNHPWIPEINITWSYDLLNILLTLVWQYFEDSCIYVHQACWLIFLFSCGILVYFLYKGNAILMWWIWKISSSSIFWKCFISMDTNFSLNIWQRLLRKPSDSGLLFVGKFSFNLLANN